MAALHTEMIEYNGIPGYFCRPQTGDTLPGLVVIQEWWGLNAHIKDVAERYASEGFVTLAPDLYRGVKTSEPDEARKLSMQLDRPRAIQDIQAAVDFLIARQDVQPKQVGVLGFCMGGGLALAMSHAGQHVGVCVVFYGGSSLMNDDTAQAVSAPILGLYGGEDASTPVGTVRANEQKLQSHNKTAQFVIYPGAPHAFFNDTRDSYRPEAAQDAWQLSLKWLRRHLA